MFQRTVIQSKQHANCFKFNRIKFVSDIDYLSLFLSVFNRQIRIMSTNTGELRIGTHNGVFHCDEILACYMLQQLPKYKNARIIRSRDENVLKDCDIVVDVGAVFNPNILRFDHHQKTFEHTLGSLRPEYAEKFSKVRLSSAGLIYTHFGLDVIRILVKQLKGIEKFIISKVILYF